MRQPSKIEMWTDGDCPLCRKTRQWVEMRDERGVILVRDYHEAADDDLPISRRKVEEAIYARASNGTVFAGFEAWRQVFASLRGWAWLAAILGIPPFSWLGRLAYRVVAANRWRLSRILFGSPIPVDRRRSKVG